MWRVVGEGLFSGFCLEQVGEKGSRHVDQFGVKDGEGMCLFSSVRRSSEMSQHGDAVGALEFGMPVLLL